MEERRLAGAQRYFCEWQDRVVLRMIVDEYATANLAGICEVSDDGNHLTLRFAQFYPIQVAKTNSSFCMMKSLGRSGCSQTSLRTRKTFNITTTS